MSSGGLLSRAQKPQDEQPRYTYSENHDPDGIGKFYMGREIAQVMGHEGADWLDRPEREAEEAPSMLLKALKLKPGMVVADVGAGSGALSFPMAKLVAPSGKVMVENIVPVLGTITDTKLPDSSVDLILLVDVYHEFDHPWEMTRSMVKALKPGGRLVFVEYRAEDPEVPIKPVHKMSVRQVRKEMSVQPLRWVETNEVLPRQHIIVFAKTATNAK
jgi:ubiquinone/menaquinone biosynthesis C-methylase UbiE